MWNAQMVQDAKDHVVHQGFNCLWTMIEPGACGNDVGTRTGQAQHILKVNGVEGSLARHNYQSASFLERYIRGPMNQVCSGARGNRTERSIEQGTMTMPCCGCEPDEGLAAMLSKRWR